MAEHDLKTKLDAALRLRGPRPLKYAAFLAKLTAVADYLGEIIDAGHGQASVDVEPGHLLVAGQQFNVAINIPQLNSYRDTIFRAYLKPDGTAATLDFLGDDPRTVKNSTAMEDVVAEFLSQDAIRDMIRSLQELVIQAARRRPPVAPATTPSATPPARSSK